MTLHVFLSSKRLLNHEVDEMYNEQTIEYENSLGIWMDEKENTTLTLIP